MLWSIIIIPITGFFTKKVVDYFYPNKINEIIKKNSYNYGWYLLDAFSRVEIKLSNIWYKYKEYIPFSFNTNNQQFFFIKDGKEIDKCNLNEFNIRQKYKHFPFEYDFILHYIPIEKIDKYDKYDSCYKRYDNHADVIENIYTKPPKCIEFTMVVVSIKNSDKTYCIDHGREQFNINGNVLYDNSFLKWALKKYHHLSITDNDEYTITFIDHNMNYITLPNTCYILIDNTDYKIVNYNNSL